jgi:hypothetical protein
MAFTPEEKKVIIEALSRHVEDSNAKSPEAGLGIVDLVMLTPAEKEVLLREWLPRLTEAKLSALDDLERKNVALAESLANMGLKVEAMKASIAATASLSKKLS